MEVPNLSSEQQNLIKSVQKYLAGEFSFGYSFINGRYCSVTEHKFEEGKTYKIMLCKPENKPEDLHILFLKENHFGNWEVFGEILSFTKEVDRIYLKDINSDGKDEILLCKNNNAQVYCVNNNEILKLETLKNID